MTIGTRYNDNGIIIADEVGVVRVDEVERNMTMGTCNINSEMTGEVVHLDEVEVLSNCCTMPGSLTLTCTKPQMTTIIPCGVLYVINEGILRETAESPQTEIGIFEERVGWSKTPKK